MALMTRWLDLCTAGGRRSMVAARGVYIIGGPAINYDLSLIDNSSGEEVISQSGHDCENRAAEKFADALNGNVR
jgi:hypothetical protein